MISLGTVKRYCKEYWKIENYEEAANSNEKWQCHHRLEFFPFSGKSVSMRYLIEQGMYYNVQPEALIFLPTSEHRKLHMVGNKLGYLLKGQTAWNKDKKCPQISEKLKGKHPNVSDETREKRRQAMIRLNKSRLGKPSWNKGKKTGPMNLSDEERERRRQRIIQMNKNR